MMKRYTILALLLLALSVNVLGQKDKNTSGKSAVKHLEFKQTVNDAGIKYMPVLTIQNLKFTDANGNQALNASESGFLSFTLHNSGKGEANNVKILISSHKTDEAIVFDNPTSIEAIYPGQSTEVYIPLSASDQLDDGTALIKISTEDLNNVKSTTEVITIETIRFRAPKVVVADAVFSTNNGEPIKQNLPVFLTVLVQNIGEGEADNVMAEFQIPDDCIALGKSINNIGHLAKGEVRELQFAFVPTNNYSEKEIPVEIDLKENYGEYAVSKPISVLIGEEILAVNRSIEKNTIDAEGEIVVASLTAEVDKNIPLSQKKNPNIIALIIGNEDYYSRHSGNNHESNVDYARNDAQIFREYAMNMLGVEEKNAFFLVDATAAEMKESIEIVSRLANKMGPDAEILFYYAGHGLPDEVTRAPYLIPVNISGANLSAAIPLNDVYTQFGKSGASKVTIFLDACFSGGGRNSGLLAARAVRVKPKEELLPGKIVVFSASSNEQMALPFAEKQHGMFTYYLLKKFQESEGELSYGELSEYLEKNVAIESLRINHKDQDPKVSVSNEVETEWISWRFLEK